MHAHTWGIPVHWDKELCLYNVFSHLLLTAVWYGFLFHSPQQIIHVSPVSVVSKKYSEPFYTRTGWHCSCFLKNVIYMCHSNRSPLVSTKLTHCTSITIVQSYIWVGSLSNNAKGTLQTALPLGLYLVAVLLQWHNKGKFFSFFMDILRSDKKRSVPILVNCVMSS